MLIALLTMTLLGGGNTPFFPKETKAAIKEVVVDPVRQKAVLAEVKEVEKFRKQPNKSGQEARRTWRVWRSIRRLVRRRFEPPTIPFSISDARLERLTLRPSSRCETI